MFIEKTFQVLCLFLRAGKEFKNRTHGSKGSKWKRVVAGNYNVMGNYGFPGSA